MRAAVRRHGCVVQLYAADVVVNWVELVSDKYPFLRSITGDPNAQLYCCSLLLP